MEPVVKQEFTKAITICGEKPEYENIKDFMQDMIDDDVSLASKDTPTHLLKFIQNAAYNKQFNEDFRKCMENVLFERHVDDKATMFHLRKLFVLNKQKDERICELEKKHIIKIDNLDIEQYKKDQAEQIRMSELKSRGQFGPGDQVDEAYRIKRIEECKKKLKDQQKDEKIHELEELVDELERRVEIMRTINDSLYEELDSLREEAIPQYHKSKKQLPP